MEDSIAKKILRIQELALSCDNEAMDIFVAWQPHVTGLDVKVYINGWDSNTKNIPVIETIIYLDQEEAKKRLDQMIIDIEKLIEEIE